MRRKFLKQALIGSLLYQNPGAASSTEAAGLAWSASKGRLRLFILGSLHALHTDDHPLPHRIDYCYNKSSGVLLEFTPYERSLPAARRLVQSKGFLPKGVLLTSLLSPETGQALAGFVRRRPDLRHLLNCKPWLASIWMQEALARECNLAERLGLEAYLARRCITDGKSVRLLESQVEALDALDGIPLNVQLAEFQATLKLCTNGGYADLVRDIRLAWRKGDEKQLTSLLVSHGTEAQAFRRSVIVKRNAAWVKRIDSLQLSGDWTLAAGAGHVCGPQSLQQLLGEQGYSVQRLG